MALTPVVAALSLEAQQLQPLRKGRVVRLLTDPGLTSNQVAALIERSCLSFMPTRRDRTDFQSLGADAAVLARIDDCARRSSAAAARAAGVPPPAAGPAPVSAALTVTPAQSRITAQIGTEVAVRVTVTRAGRPAAGVRLVLAGEGAAAEAQTDARGVATFRLPVVPGPPTRPLAFAAVSGEALAGRPTIELVTTAPPVRAPAALSAGRTGFTAGGGQRGRAGARLPLPLVFEARDADNRAMAGQQVSFGATNARLEPERGVTDAAGQVRVTVTLGPTAGPAVVTATVGSVRREVTLTALAGPASRIVVACGRAVVTGRLTIGSGGASVLRVRVQDASGNVLPVTGLRVAVGDERVLRVTSSAAEGTSGRLTIAPGAAGATNLSIFASGIRVNLAASVARGEPACQ